MEGGQRDLRGADEEELVALDLVDHLPLAREEAGAVERALPDQHRRHDRLEPLRADGFDHEPDQGELDHHQVAEEVGEPRPRGRRGLLDLDPPVLEAEVEVVADLEVEAGALPDLAEGDRVVLAAGRRDGMGEVRERRREPIAALLDLGELGLERLELAGDALHALDHVGGVVPGALPRGDLVRGLVLGGPPALDLGQQLAAAGVELEQLVERGGGAAPLQRGPGRARVIADRSQVEHSAGRCA